VRQRFMVQALGLHGPQPHPLKEGVVS
jgi:hypothetical protein